VRANSNCSAVGEVYYSIALSRAYSHQGCSNDVRSGLRELSLSWTSLSKEIIRLILRIVQLFKTNNAYV
jgi:hypothetical protein